MPQPPSVLSSPSRVSGTFHSPRRTEGKASGRPGGSQPGTPRDELLVLSVWVVSVLYVTLSSLILHLPPIVLSLSV